MRVSIREDKVYSGLVIVDGWVKVMLLSVSGEDLVVWLARRGIVREGTGGGVNSSVRGGGATDARQLVDAALPGPWNAVLSEESFEVLVLFEDGVFCACDGGEVFF